MILNKKGLAVLPLAALLFTSCSPWKNISYDEAKDFIKTNYEVDGAKALYPTKVHEKFNGTAADAFSIAQSLAPSVLFFYSTNAMLNLPWSKEAPFKCDYEEDYIPSGEQWADPELLPIKSEMQGSNPIDSLIPSSKESGYTATYQINGKKFKQNLSGDDGLIKMNENVTYNEKGYRLEVTGNCKAKGEVTNPETGEKYTVDFSFSFSATYTYAE